MRQAGKMDRVLIVQRATNSVDANGTVVQTWADLMTLRAKLIESAVLDTEHNGIAISDSKFKLQTYFTDNITLEDRVSYNGVSYQIKHLSEIGRRRGLELHVEAFEPS
ncbi:MAG TPA: head-tail adaptor protein [Xanthobacteraceae bacterium]|nr:head-tail adaptor protein [Xanthobacteraceae bacterium]